MVWSLYSRKSAFLINRLIDLHMQTEKKVTFYNEVHFVYIRYCIIYYKLTMKNRLLLQLLLMKLDFN